MIVQPGGEVGAALTERLPSSSVNGSSSSGRESSQR
jgi:hypothetical protein